MDTYYVQTQAKKMLKCIYRRGKEGLRVCPEYLNGLDETEFWGAFDELRGIFERYYATAAKNPSELNLPLYETEKYRNMSEETRKSNYALMNLPITLLSAAFAAKFDGGSLSADTDSFKQALKILGGKKTAGQINLLSDYGFTFSGWNGKKFIINTFEIGYPDNPNMPAVLAAIGSRLKKYYDSLENKQMIRWLMSMEHFIFFIPHIFTTDKAALPPKTLEHMIDTADKRHSGALYEIIKQFKKRGLEIKQFDSAFLKNRFINEQGKDTLNHLTLGDYKYGGNESIFLRLKLNNPDKYIEKISALPPHLKNTFIHTYCGDCAEKCNRRIIYTLDGELKRTCACEAFAFMNPNAEDIDALMELYDAEQIARLK